MIPLMKAVLILFCLLAVPVVSQSTGVKVKTGSRVPSVSLTFAAEAGGNDSFNIQNASGHAITAFDVLLVPHGVQEKNDHFLCRGRCAESSEVGTIDHPAIAASKVRQVSYETSQVTGGAVILEAAVFDDGTYAGNERSAAYLVAKQLGNQAEFDRIVSSVEMVLTGTDLQNTSKANRINAELSVLPVAVDSATLAAFYRWFPNLQDCERRFPQIVQSASAQELSEAQSKLSPLLKGGETSAADLTRWWGATEQFLTGFGCNDCTDRLASPTPPVAKRLVSVGCNGGQTQPMQSSGDVALAIGIAEDTEPDDNAAEQPAANDSDSGGVADQGGNDNNQSMSEEPGDASARGNTPTAQMQGASDTVEPSSPRRCHLQAPRPFGIAGIGIEPAQRAGLRPESTQHGLRPATDEQLYSRYFRYVAGWDDCLSRGISPDSLAEQYPDPYPAGMNENQRTIVTVVAGDWVQSWQESMKASGPTTVAVLGPPDTWARFQELKERRQRFSDLTDERAKVIESRLQSLRLSLGKASFRAFDDYVHGLYQTVPGRLVRQPLSEGATLARYLGYIASMDKFAATSGDDAQAATKARADEQDRCGLSDKDEGILREEADSFARDIREHQPQPRTNTNFPEIRSARAIPPQERQQIADSHMEHLQSTLSKAGFEKVAKRVQELYQSDGPKRVIPATDPDPMSPSPKSKEAEVQTPAPGRNP